MNITKPAKELVSVLTSAGSKDEDPKLQAQLRDLLDKGFALDPERRLTVAQALQHPFISGK